MIATKHSALTMLGIWFHYYSYSIIMHEATRCQVSISFLLPREESSVGA